MLTDKAMKAEELRLYNYVGCKISNDKGVYQVIAFPEWTTESERPITINRCPKETMPISKVKPIPLTEEWLEKFGFRYSEPLKMHVLYNNPATCEPDDYEDSVYHNVDFFYNGECFGFEVSNEWGENGNLMMSKIKHVHQLQNLYFALTGEELTLKP